MRKIHMDGEILEKMPKSIYIVRIKNGSISMDIEARIGIKDKVKFLRLLPGDKVIVEMSLQDLAKGKIVGVKN